MVCKTKNIALQSKTDNLGCPNCKAKRIKCTEELPKCFNCVKKNYRCGYLDFPKDKLDHIRKKNEKAGKVYNFYPSSVNEFQGDQGLLQEYSLEHGDISFEKNLHQRQLESVNYQNYTPSDGYVNTLAQNQPNIYLQTLNGQGLSTNSVSITAQPTQQDLALHSVSNVVNVPITLDTNTSTESTTMTDMKDITTKNIFSNVQPITHNVLEPDFFTTRDDLRNAVYKQTSLQFLLESQIPPTAGMNPVIKDVIGPFVHEVISSWQDGEQDFLRLGRELFQQSRASLGRHLKTGGNVEDDYIEKKLNALEDVPYQHEYDKNTQFKLTFIPHFNKYNIFQPRPPPKSIHGKPLAGAIIKPTTIPTIKKQIKNDFLHNFLRKYRKDVMKMSTDAYQNYSPVWCDNQYLSFWKSVFNQSVLIDVYFSFFMDKAINVLLKTCNFMLSATEASLYNKNISSRNGRTEKLLWSSFTMHDLKVLTRKSYYYYGLFIRDIRESLTEINIEFPTKISLYGSWSTFLHANASLSTLLLMFSGTAFLMQKIFIETKTIKDLGPTMIVVNQLFNDLANWSLTPDYDFQVINSLYVDLMTFKYFLIDNSTLAGATDELVLREFLDLEKFLKELIYNIYPNMIAINDVFRERNKDEDIPENIKYFLTSMVFNLIVSWFNVFPSGCLSISSSMSPIKKTLYLYYHAVGKALMHVFPCIRSVFLVDPVHVLMPKVAFNSRVYEISLADVGHLVEHYKFVINQSQKLIRMIKFFNCRVQIVSYFLHTRSVLEDENGETYIKNMDIDHDKVLHPVFKKYSDIILFTNPKMDLEEVMLTEFTESIRLENFPLLENLHQKVEDKFVGADLLKLIQKEQKDRSSRRKSPETEYAEDDSDLSTPMNQSSRNEINGISSNSSNSTPSSHRQLISETTTTSSLNSHNENTLAQHRASRRGSFNYDKGFFTGDYDPSEAIIFFAKYRDSQFTLNDSKLVPFQKRMNSFKLSRNVLSDSTTSLDTPNYNHKQ